MKKPKTVLNDWVLVFGMGLLWAIVLILALLAIGWFSKAIAGTTPSIPSIHTLVRWEVEQVPRNVTVVWASGLQMAFPIQSSGHFTHAENFHQSGALWYFRDACTSYTRIVWPSPSLYRWGDYDAWRPYIERIYFR